MHFVGEIRGFWQVYSYHLYNRDTFRYVFFKEQRVMSGFTNSEPTQFADTKIGILDILIVLLRIITAAIVGIKNYYPVVINELFENAF